MQAHGQTAPDGHAAHDPTLLSARNGPADPCGARRGHWLRSSSDRRGEGEGKEVGRTGDDADIGSGDRSRSADHHLAARLRKVRTGEGDSCSRLTRGAAGARPGVALVGSVVVRSGGLRGLRVYGVMALVMCPVPGLLRSRCLRIVVGAGVHTEPVACRSEQEGDRPEEGENALVKRALHGAGAGAHIASHSFEAKGTTVRVQEASRLAYRIV